MSPFTPGTREGRSPSPPWCSQPPAERGARGPAGLCAPVLESACPARDDPRVAIALKTRPALLTSGTLDSGPGACGRARFATGDRGRTATAPGQIAALMLARRVNGLATTPHRS